MRRAVLTTIGVPLLAAATSAEAMRSDLATAASKTATHLVVAILRWQVMAL